MANPYATENFLRKQCRLRDERIRDLELVLREAQTYLRGLEHVLAGGPDGEIQALMDIEDRVSAALKPTPKDIVVC